MVHQMIREQHNNVIPHSDSEADRGAETEKKASRLGGEDSYRMNKNNCVYNLRRGNKKVLIPHYYVPSLFRGEKAGESLITRAQEYFMFGLNWTLRAMR